MAIEDNYSDEEAPNIAMIGGGTGSFTLLHELKNFTPNISALVNMSDDGNSSGRLRDEYGVLPPGDVRQCLVALGNAPEIRDLFSYRFPDGQFEGHALGNIILSGLELRYEDFAKAIKVASKILDITGEVIPITTDKHTLVMEDGGETVRGEHAISHREIQAAGAYLRLEPEAAITPEAEEAITKADIITIAPGNLFGSLLPILTVRGVAETVRSARAMVVLVANLVTKPGQTDGWHVVDYVKMFEQYLGENEIDKVLYNTRLPSSDLLAKYAADGEFPVAIEPEERFNEVSAIAVGTDLLAGKIFLQDPNDKGMRRTLIRHDGIKVGRQLMQICAWPPNH